MIDIGRTPSRPLCLFLVLSLFYAATAFANAWENKGPVISKEELRASMDTPDLVILDLRDGRGEGLDLEEAPPIYRSGHIPGALPFGIGKFLGEGDFEARVRALKEVLARTGPRVGDPISDGAQLVIYAGVEDEPLLEGAATVLSAAGRKVRILAGGFEAWAADPRSPIVEVIDAHQLAARLAERNPGLKADLKAPDLALFDVRPYDVARRRHLPGAGILDSDEIDLTLGTAIATHWPTLDRTRDAIAFYCYGRTCIRSREAGIAAARLGYRHILWFRDGMPGWKQAGLPVFGDEVPNGLSGSR